MPHHHDFADAQLGDREFERRRHAVAPAAALERRDEVGDVADDEDLARIGVEDRRRIGAAVAAGDDDRARRLPFGQARASATSRPRSAFRESGGSPPADCSSSSIRLPCDALRLARDGEGWQAARAVRYLALHERNAPDRARHAAPPAQARLDPRQGAGQPGLCRDQAADARPQPRHGVRGSGVPQHRRMLDQEARHGDDPGRHLHARLRLLQRQDGDAARGRRAGARAIPRRRRRRWGSSISSSPRSTATICPTAGRASSSRSSRRCAARRPTRRSRS